MSADLFSSTQPLHLSEGRPSPARRCGRLHSPGVIRCRSHRYEVPTLFFKDFPNSPSAAFPRSAVSTPVYLRANRRRVFPDSPKFTVTKDPRW